MREMAEYTGRETLEKDYVGLVSAFVYQGVDQDYLSKLWR